MANIIDIQKAKSFIKLQKDLKKLLERGVLSKKKIYEACGMAKATLDRKLMNQSFTGYEMLEIAKYINSLKT